MHPFLYPNSPIIVLMIAFLQDWFFDMIIGFLRSPRWKTPVMSFIDEYCTVFDDEDENKLEFTKIHNVS